MLAFSGKALLRLSNAASVVTRGVSPCGCSGDMDLGFVRIALRGGLAESVLPENVRSSAEDTLLLTLSETHDQGASNSHVNPHWQVCMLSVAHLL
jgi:hypothetical protein